MANKTFAKIILLMKQRFLEGNTEKLSLDEILMKLKICDLPKNARKILDTDLLVNSPKLIFKNIDGVNKYSFKPKFNIRNRTELSNLIRKRLQNYCAGVPVDDIAESVPNAEKVLTKIDEVTVLKGAGGEKIAFYNEKIDKEGPFIDKDLIGYWNTVSVDGLNEMAIEDYLVKRGHFAMKSEPLLITTTLKTTSKRILKPKKLLNEHLGYNLIDYKNTSRTSQ